MASRHSSHGYSLRQPRCFRYPFWHRGQLAPATLRPFADLSGRTLGINTLTTDVVSERLDMSLSEAKGFIYDVLSLLTEEDFWKTSPNPPPPADIYGTIAQRIAWYIKLKILQSDRLS